MHEGVHKRVIAGSTRIERTLDPSGARVLVSRPGAAGGRVYTITRWFTDWGCDLPEDTQRVYDVLLPAELARGSDDRLWLPVGRSQGGRLTLWLSDARCRLEGPLGAPEVPLAADSVRVFASLDDGRSLLTFQDEQRSLFVLDPAHAGAPTRVATEVQEARRTVASVGGALQDAFWLREGGVLTHRSLAGDLLLRVGEQVSEFALYDGLSPRVAYVAAGDLYEALPPRYEPILRAEGACAPSYGAAALDMHRPCAARQLTRMPLATELFESFAEGTYRSLTLGELRFDYVHTDGGEQLYVESPSLGRSRIEPVLLAESLTLVQTRRVLGRSATGEVGSFHLSTQRFEPLFRDVGEVVAHEELETGLVHWLIHHGEVAGLGTLSVLRVSDLTVRQVSAHVPTAARRGYQLLPHAVLGKLRAPEPLLLYLEDVDARGAPPGALVRGRLSATLLGVTMPMQLAEEASSYAFVSQPFTGLLIGIEEGERSGIWASGL